MKMRKTTAFPKFHLFICNRSTEQVVQSAVFTFSPKGLIPKKLCSGGSRGIEVQFRSLPGISYQMENSYFIGN